MNDGPFKAIGDTWNEMWQYERRALCELAFVDPGRASLQWSAFDAPTREKIIRAWRAAIDLGTCCAAAVLKAQARMSFATDMRDGSRLAKFWSRAEWKALPLEFVLVPALDGPVLVFDQTPIFVDPFGGNRRPCYALAMLDEMRSTYPRIYDGDKRAWAMKLLRQLWLQLVDQAECYTWPDATHYGVPAFYLFAPD